MQLLPRHLYSQLILLISLILIASIASYSWITSSRQAITLQRTIRLNAELMTENLADGCAHYMVINDYAGLELLLMRTARMTEILRIQVIEADGTVTADVMREPGNLPKAILSPQPVRSPGPIDDVGVTPTEILVVKKTISAGRVLGTLKITYNTESVDEMKAALWKDGLAMSVLWISAGIALLLVVLRPPVQDIKTLADFARRLDTLKGKQLEINNPSVEIGGLADSINSASRELYKSELQLLAERERLAVTLESIGDGVIASDKEGAIVFINRVAGELSGWTPEEARGKPLKEILRIVDEKDHAPMAYPHEEALNKGAIVKLSELTLLISRDGTERNIADSAAPIIDAEGNAIGVVMVFRDVTDLKEMAAEKEKLQRQLLQAQKMEAVGLLTGGIAHDFNNILTAIIGYGHVMLMKLPDGNPLRHYTEQILSSSERAAQLVQSLLAFGRKQLIDLKRINLNDLVKRVEKLLLRLIGEDIELRTVLHDGALFVTADSGQIEQVLMNLAMNARDAMPNGGILSIETGLFEVDETYLKSHLFEHPGKYVFLSVSDTGVGMDATTRERVFEPFFTTKEPGKGTGLGLSMVYGIIKQHNGSINIYSEPGKGAAFKIYLPMDLTCAEDVCKPTPPPPRGGTETILLVEDEEDVRNLLTIILQQAGYNVMEARDGEDGVEKFRTNRDGVQLLLSDVIMPKMNGKELYEELRRIAPGLKALFVSGYTADIVSRKGIIESGLHFVSKPVAPDVLLRKVREVLDEKPEEKPATPVNV